MGFTLLGCCRYERSKSERAWEMNWEGGLQWFMGFGTARHTMILLPSTIIVLRGHRIWPCSSLVFSVPGSLDQSTGFERIVP